MNSKANNIKAVAVIPARFASTRLPGKPLALINGKSMISIVYNNVKKSKMIDSVLVATDDERIAFECDKHNMNCIMTDRNLPSGTDRIYQALRRINSKPDIVVNIQGDEPLLKHTLIDELLENFINEDADVGTVIKKIDSLDELNSPSVVKVTIDDNNNALYFSRSIIPHIRDYSKNDWLDNHIFYKHIGIYAYKFDAIQKFVNLNQSSLELAENLEQLRLLQSGAKYYCYETEDLLHGVDTPDDIPLVEKLLI